MWERSSSPYAGFARLRDFTFRAVRKGSLPEQPSGDRPCRGLSQPVQVDGLIGGYLKASSLSPRFENGEVRAYDLARGIVRVSTQQEQPRELLSAAVTRSAILLARIILLLLVFGCLSRAFASNVHPVPLDKNT